MTPAVEPLPHSVPLHPLPKRIKRAAADLAGVTVAELDGPSRKQALAHPRQAGMFVMRNNTGLSLPAIGRRFGGRDHATVFHAIRAIEADYDAGKTCEGSRPWMVAQIRERVGL